MSFAEGLVWPQASQTCCDSNLTLLEWLFDLILSTFLSPVANNCVRHNYSSTLIPITFKIIFSTVHAFIKFKVCIWNKSRWKDTILAHTPCVFSNICFVNATQRTANSCPCKFSFSSNFYHWNMHLFAIKPGKTRDAIHVQSTQCLISLNDFNVNSFWKANRIWLQTTFFLWNLFVEICAHFYQIGNSISFLRSHTTNDSNDNPLNT